MSDSLPLKEFNPFIAYNTSGACDPVFLPVIKKVMDKHSATAVADSRQVRLQSSFSLIGSLLCKYVCRR
jgi:hypothetical protein